MVVIGDILKFPSATGISSFNTQRSLQTGMNGWDLTFRHVLFVMLNILVLKFFFLLKNVNMFEF